MADNPSKSTLDPGISWLQKVQGIQLTGFPPETEASEKAKFDVWFSKYKGSSDDVLKAEAVDLFIKDFKHDPVSFATLVAMNLLGSNDLTNINVSQAWNNCKQIGVSDMQSFAATVEGISTLLLQGCGTENGVGYPGFAELIRRASTQLSSDNRTVEFSDVTPNLILFTVIFSNENKFPKGQLFAKFLHSQAPLRIEIRDLVDISEFLWKNAMGDKFDNLQELSCKYIGDFENWLPSYLSQNEQKH